jgi:hypothetical protein
MPTSNQSKYRALTVDEYFARLPSRDCVLRCQDLIEGYYTEATRSGRIALYRTSFYDYYEGFLVKGQLYRKGAQGEQTGITVNNYHNFIKHRVNQTCEQRLSYEPQAIDGSHKAMEQVRLARGLLDLYTERPDIDMDGRLRQCTQFSQMFAEGYIAALWDETKGKPVALDTNSGSLVPEGDVSLKVYDPLSVIRDVYRSDAQSDQWRILKEEVNKVDLAVQYPQFEELIMADSLEAIYKDRQIYPCYSPLSDIIWVWTLFHDRTVAVPEGRLLKFVNENVILEDGPLPEEYESLKTTLIRMAEEDLAGSPWGYTDTFDALPLCNAISRLHSTVLTNNVTFGLQHILVPRDGGFNEASLGTGLTALEWDAAKGEAYKPEALNLTKSAPETYEYINTLTQTVGTLMGINEVTRGNPDLVLKGAQSGAALALMSTQSIQFNSGLGKAYQLTAELLGTAVIKMLAKRSVVPRQGRVLAMSGKPYTKQFKGNDLSLIDKVSVKTGNPLAQTTSGRLQIAESLLAGQFIKNRQDYMQVIETGSLDPLLESTDMEIALIKDENDALGQGPIPDAVVFDDHVTHVAEHKVLLASVEARKNPQLIQDVVKHIQSHLDFLAGNAQHGPMNPILATIGNQPTLPPGTPNGIVLPKMPAPPQPGAPGAMPGGPGLPPRPPMPPRPAPRPAPGANAVPTPNAGPNMPSSVKLPVPPKGAPMPLQ